MKYYIIEDKNVVKEDISEYGIVETKIKNGVNLPYKIVHKEYTDNNVVVTTVIRTKTLEMAEKIVDMLNKND